MFLRLQANAQSLISVGGSPRDPDPGSRGECGPHNPGLAGRWMRSWGSVPGREGTYGGSVAEERVSGGNKPQVLTFPCGPRIGRGSTLMGRRGKHPGLFLARLLDGSPSWTRRLRRRGRGTRRGRERSDGIFLARLWLDGSPSWTDRPGRRGRSFRRRWGSFTRCSLARLLLDDSPSWRRKVWRGEKSFKYGASGAWGLVIVWGPHVEAGSFSLSGRFGDREWVLRNVLYVDPGVREIRSRLPGGSPQSSNRPGKSGYPYHHPEHRHLPR